MSEFRQLAPTVEQAWEHLEQLNVATYIGNTVLIGITPDGESYQQVCWLTGRDESERNRSFEISEWSQGEFVQTRREPEAGVSYKPYPTMLSVEDAPARRTLHVVTTGDRTRAIMQSILPDPKHGRLHRQPFGTSTKLYNPDPYDSYHTPRVSGVLDIGIGIKNFYGRKETHVNYNILTRGGYSAVNEYPLRLYATPGVALAAHAYHPQIGAPELFHGFPYPLPIFDDAETTRDFWWELLPADQRVAIAVLSISGLQRTYALLNA